MESMILAFAGGIGSGKTTVSTKVSERLGWPRASFGDYVKHVATTRGLDHSRDTLQTVGESLVSEGWVEFCNNVLKRANWRHGQDLVIDGIRHVKAFETIKQIASPSKVLLFYIVLDSSAREKRLSDDRRGKVLHKHELHSTEVEVHTALPQIADFCLDGTMDAETLVNSVLTSIGLSF